MRVHSVHCLREWQTIVIIYNIFYNVLPFKKFLAYLLGLYFLHCRLSVQFNFIIKCLQAWIITQPIRLLISNLTAGCIGLVS